MALKKLDPKLQLIIEVLMGLFFVTALIMYGSVILGYFQYVFSFFK